MFSAVKSVFTGGNITKYSAVAPEGNAPVMAVQHKGSTVYVKIPYGVPPGGIFYYKEKEIMREKPASMNALERHFEPEFPPPSSNSSPPKSIAPAAVVAPVLVQQPSYYPSQQIHNGSPAYSPTASSQNSSKPSPGQSGGGATYRVVVPIDTRPGQTFHVMINGEKVALVVPPEVFPGSILTIQGPAPLPAPSAPPTYNAEYANIPVATLVSVDDGTYGGSYAEAHAVPMSG